METEPFWPRLRHLWRYRETLSIALNMDIKKKLALEAIFKWNISGMNANIILLGYTGPKIISLSRSHVKGQCHQVTRWPWLSPYFQNIKITGGYRAELPSSRWGRRSRSLREVIACSRLYATTDLSQICNMGGVTRGVWCTLHQNDRLVLFLVFVQ